jgi:hypothetical protein
MVGRARLVPVDAYWSSFPGGHGRETRTMGRFAGIRLLSAGTGRAIAGLG